MAQIAGIKTEKNTKGVVTKITIDLKKHPEAKKPLIEIGLLGKSAEELEREAFYKKINDPTNLTLDECFDGLHRKIATLKWDK